MGHHMGTKRSPQMLVRALAQQVFVNLAQDRAEPVGIVIVERNAVGRFAPQPIGARSGHRADKQPLVPFNRGQGIDRSVRLCRQQGRTGIEGRNLANAMPVMRPQNRKWIIVLAGAKP
jgi:hypothetical protein